MNALTIPTHVQTELAAEATRTTQGMALLEAFVVDTDEALSFAGELVRDVKERWKVLEEKRTSITAPINEALRAANSLFKPVQEPLKRAEAVLKQKIAAYTLAQRAAQEATMQAAAEAIRTGDAPGAAAAVAALGPVAAVAGVGVRARWGWRVVDEAAVPRQFCSPDPDKIRAAIPKEVHEKLTPQIAGVEFFVEGAVAVRT